jgi:hypothetical protein
MKDVVKNSGIKAIDKKAGWITDFVAGEKHV